MLFNNIVTNDLDLSNNIVADNLSKDELVFYGLYYETINEYEIAMEYYKKCIEKEHYIVLDRMGLYYERINSPKMIKYYEMAVTKNNSMKAMFNLGLYYDNIDDYDNMIKYYTMAIEKHKCVSSMVNIANHYCDVEHDYENAEKYYLMGVAENCELAIVNLASMYNELERYNEMMNLFLLAIEKYNNKESQNHINKHFFSILEHIDIDIIKRCHSYLSKYNINKLNKKIEKATRNKKLAKLSDVDECCICLEEKDIVYYKCKHGACIDCYKKVDKCSLCR